MGGVWLGRCLLGCLILQMAVHCGWAQDVGASDAISRILAGEFRWERSEPLVEVRPELLPRSDEHPWVSIKDPSVVRHDGRWHLFCSMRKQKQGDGRIRIGYASFGEWSEAGKAKWSVLDLTMGYHGAPQIFYYTPHETWYLIYQAEDGGRGLKYGPCYSTNSDLSEPEGWTKPKPLYEVAEGERAGLDFWVICDDETAHLFFTTLNGKMWRCETSRADFPDRNWSKPKVVLEADIFEASHVYRLRGTDHYLALIEAQGEARRYYKAYVAEGLRGEWRPVAGTAEKPFASGVNVLDQAQSWTASYSHGELIRIGSDERLEVDPEGLRFVFQGASDAEYRSQGYGGIPWRLGILTAR